VLECDRSQGVAPERTPKAEATTGLTPKKASATGPLMATVGFPSEGLVYEKARPGIRELFGVRMATANVSPYAVAPDGKRFLLLTPASGSQALEVVANWPALLKKGAAAE